MYNSIKIFLKIESVNKIVIHLISILIKSATQLLRDHTFTMSSNFLYLSLPSPLISNIVSTRAPTSYNIKFDITTPPPNFMLTIYELYICWYYRTLVQQATERLSKIYIARCGYTWLDESRWCQEWPISPITIMYLKIPSEKMKSFCLHKTGFSVLI